LDSCSEESCHTGGYSNQHHYRRFGKVFRRLTACRFDSVSGSHYVLAMDIESVKKTLKQYLALKSETDLLVTRSNELKKRLTEDVESLGEVDDRGHINLEVDGTKLTKQRKVSKNLDMSIAENVLKERGIYDKCVKMVPVLQEDEILACVYTGELTEADIDTMFPAKVSYAFLVKEM
jgi:hypothetical protein